MGTKGAKEPKGSESPEPAKESKSPKSSELDRESKSSELAKGSESLKSVEEPKESVESKGRRRGAKESKGSWPKDEEPWFYQGSRLCCAIPSRPGW